MIMNDNINNFEINHGANQQTVFDRQTYEYARTPVKSGAENRPVVASRLNLPLETDGPATCLVFFNSYSSLI